MPIFAEFERGIYAIRAYAIQKKKKSGRPNTVTGANLKSTNMQASGCLSGVPTGFKSLDEVITGLKEKGDFRKDQAKE